MFVIAFLFLHTLTKRTCPPRPLTGAPYFASIAWATREIIGRVSSLLYLVLELLLTLVFVVPSSLLLDSPL
jgi:hypothetical protein